MTDRLQITVTSTGAGKGVVVVETPDELWNAVVAALNPPRGQVVVSRVHDVHETENGAWLRSKL